MKWKIKSHQPANPVESEKSILSDFNNYVIIYNEIHYLYYEELITRSFKVKPIEYGDLQALDYGEICDVHSYHIYCSICDQLDVSKYALHGIGEYYSVLTYE